MKYPLNQFETLVKALTVLANYIDLSTMNECNLHYLVYKQFTDSQRHNWLVVSNGQLIRKFNLVGDQLVENEGMPVFSFSADFELYPDGCHDTHIITAVKKAIKEVEKNKLNNSINTVIDKMLA